jgi:cellulose synthase (UDP-forming)
MAMQRTKNSGRQKDDAFLRGEPSKVLLVANMLMAVIYFSVVTFGFRPSNPYLFGLLITGAGFYLIQIFGYCYTIWSPRFKARFGKNVNAPVDVFITVCGEPVEVVEHTLRAALAMRYPHFTVYILNDGYVRKKDNWNEIIRLAKRYNVQCLTRRIPGGAKAGNINYGLRHTASPYVTVFDADHAPHPNFLQQTMGYFVDPKVGFVQTPQYYRNQHANAVAHTAWCQQTLFFGPIMRGKNRLNAAFMCGTNMVMSRPALLQAGGMCEFNIAEDFLTSLFIHANGWKSVYVPKILAEGMAPEDFLNYYKQQYRWTRGSLEVIFKYNPFFMRGLSLHQKLQYMLSASYYVSGIAVLIHAVLPLVFLYSGLTAIHISTMSLALVFIPYIFLCLYTLQKTSNFSYTFGAIAFSLSAFYLQLRAIVAVILGQQTTFAVTTKGKVHGNFLYLALPHLVYVGLVAIGVIVGAQREGFNASLVTNVGWAIVNIVIFLPFILGASPSRRQVMEIIKTAFAAVRTKISGHRYMAVGGVTLCVAVAALAAAYLFLPQSLRVDEARNMWQASHSLAGVLSGSAQHMQMPLYPVMLHFWQLFFGNDVVMVRLLSLMAFLATIPLFYVVARQFLHRHWALVATALISFSPFINWLANDARPYALLGLLAVCSQYFFTRVITENKYWLAYGICAVLGLYTHYFFAVTLLIQVGLAVFSRRGLLPSVRTKIIGVSAVALTAWLPWLYLIYSYDPVIALSSLPAAPTSIDLFGVFAQLSLGFQSSSIHAMVIAGWPLLILSGFFAVQRQLRIHATILYIAAAGLAPIALAYLASRFTTAFFASDYMVTVVAPLTILTVWLLSHYRRMYAAIACSIAILGSIVALYHQGHSLTNPARQDYRTAALEIGSKATPQDMVVLAAPDAMYPFTYYYQGRAQLTTLPQLDSVVPTSSSVYSAAPLPLQVDKINRSHQRIYLLVSRYQGHQKQVVEYYDTHSKKISEQRLPSSLLLLVYEIERPDGGVAVAK